MNAELQEIEQYRQEHPDKLPQSVVEFIYKQLDDLLVYSEGETHIYEIMYYAGALAGISCEMAGLAGYEAHTLPDKYCVLNATKTASGVPYLIGPAITYFEYAVWNTAFKRLKAMAPDSEVQEFKDYSQMTIENFGNEEYYICGLYNPDETSHSLYMAWLTFSNMLKSCAFTDLDYVRIYTSVITLVLKKYAETLPANVLFETAICEMLYAAKSVYTTNDDQGQQQANSGFAKDKLFGRKKKEEEVPEQNAKDAQEELIRKAAEQRAKVRQQQQIAAAEKEAQAKAAEEAKKALMAPAVIEEPEAPPQPKKHLKESYITSKHAGSGSVFLNSSYVKKSKKRPAPKKKVQPDDLEMGMNSERDIYAERMAAYQDPDVASFREFALSHIPVLILFMGITLLIEYVLTLQTGLIALIIPAAALVLFLLLFAVTGKSAKKPVNVVMQFLLGLVIGSVLYVALTYFASPDTFAALTTLSR